VIVTAYADHPRAGSLDPAALLAVAADEGARGILIDTADKTGPGLIELVSRMTLASWTNAARARGLLVALAGRLSADDLAVTRRAGADVAGVRGAACEGGRGGQVERRLVERLRACCEAPIEEIRPAPAASAGRRAGVQR
jgi:uncharacterized protein (UPF0264 family)